jgi:ribosomal protein S18 acetylase RimI-like enzyme
MVTIREAGSADIAEVRTMFGEYAESLGVDLGFQRFDDEMRELPGDYWRPAGVLLRADLGGRAVGCVAVRRLDADACEMKRLYVRDEARGHGVGRALAEAAIRFARSAGYRAMRLDTLPSMATAQALYSRLGFRDVAPYRFNPVPGTRFLELTLAE